MASHTQETLRRRANERVGLSELNPSMANLSDRLPQNHSGAYYVDASCIDCDQCRAIAPEIFGRDPDTGTSFVIRQPVTADEVLQVEQIMTECATSSIGNDGA